MKINAKVYLYLSIAFFTLQSQVSINDPKPQDNISPISEAKAVTAQVFVTDVVIQGSLCVGFDCVNGESFGFDTERLKENNLRINFMDTSNSGSFPTRDWRLVANDTQNGGANYFALEDSDSGTQPFRVDADAGNNALRIDSQGDVGLGTSNPVVELHMADGDSPAMRLEQNGSSGFTPQTWDIAGNETNFFIRDVTNGSKLPFRIRPNAPENSLYINTNGNVGLGTNSPNYRLQVVGTAFAKEIDLKRDEDNGGSNLKITSASNSNKGLIVRRSQSSEQDGTFFFHNNLGNFPLNLALMENGNVGIGTLAPTANNKLEVIGNTRIVGDLVVTGTVTASPGGVNSVIEGGKGVLGTESNPYPNLYVAGQSNFSDLSYFEKDIYVKGSVMPGSIYGPSDRNLKDHITSVADATSVIMRLKPVSFKYKDKYQKEMGLPDRVQYGLIAQEVENILPSLVKGFELQKGGEFKSVNYNGLISLLVKSFQEQEKKIENQEKKINELEAKLSNYASLENRLATIEQKISTKSSNAKR
ncbi:MAG: tail fiber domain-containing protein [Cytophagales bacterium]|nr:tail fiber domain-containing protein [Cytophagales bacterium]